MPLTDLIKEMEQQLLDGQSLDQEEDKDVELFNSCSRAEVLECVLCQ